MTLFSDAAQRGWLPGGQGSDLQWSRNQPRMSRERRAKVIIAYLPDWVLTILLAGVLAIINKAHGFRREFSLTDTSLQHTYAVTERVPVWLLVVTTVIIPIVLIAFIGLVTCRSFWDCHAGLLGLILAHALTVTATTIIKVTVGRPRPDVIDRCQPPGEASNASPYGLVTDAICTRPVDSSIITDGFRSFPSGHSSTAFAGMAFLSLYLAGKVRLFDHRGHAASAWLVFFPMIGATLIAISRLEDYRHHPTDVIAGGILGTIISTTIYHLYYPPLWDRRCQKPWAPRIPRQTLPSNELEAEGLAAEPYHEHASDSAGGAQCVTSTDGLPTISPHGAPVQPYSHPITP
ncbi:acid phosphatase/Vanadium-dependent haloperoxidase [Tilletiaria anomala UBC 951]|uniref:Acid phosphatase/Vanadium-dependent haloperoxidase n=1 Tax=Tilletiaria anomala (strain ATCC 24038 / CBS 436.72 / UBC 951) TaxID=1037660 RepID=A0A066VTZ4_TILAU|nr:acid phosphatase/Vanadium-dependent haloperoxidase [Tilletiaria anomala UBC 951]KDN44931.1 acid phosphatase/Vanadium-dependent haloperoxidase [Tilletiaria anomala UBC 951]